MSSPFGWGLAILVLLQLFSGATTSWSQAPPRTKSLDERVQSLEKIVVALNARVKKLEAELAARGRVNESNTKPVSLDDLDGKAIIVGDKGEYLGLISSDALNAKSILNDVGTYGSDVSPKSILNDVGKYGSDVSPESAFNDIATSPPKIFLDGKFVAYLTKNELKSPRIDPDVLLGHLKSRK